MIKLIVDSSADCPDFVAKDERVTILPLSINFGDQEYFDRRTITPAEFFEKLKTEKEMPKTSQVTPQAFADEFKKELAAGNQVVCLTIASSASGTFQSAMIAKEEVGGEDNILLIDSNMLCIGEGYLAIKILKWIEEGKGLSEIAELAKPYTENRIEHLFSVDTLEFLKRGGRITGTKAFVAELLDLKPILIVEDGMTKPIGKVRGRKRVIPYYIKHMKENLDWDQNEFIVLGHGADLAIAKQLEQAIREELHWEKPIYISEIGPTIGTHSGPGVFAVFYVKKEKK